MQDIQKSKMDDHTTPKKLFFKFTKGKLLIIKTAIGCSIVLVVIILFSITQGFVFNQIKGICTITSVRPAYTILGEVVYDDLIEKSPAFEVEYKFLHFDYGLLNPIFLLTTNDSYFVTNNGFSHVGPRFIKVFDLYPGKKHSCTLVKHPCSSCAPTVTDLDSITADSLAELYYGPLRKEGILR